MNPKKRFDIREHDSSGRLIATIEAPNVFEAAQRAAGTYFKRCMATRETGWGGKAGVWAARRSVDDPPTSEKLFHVMEAPDGSVG